ncbi:MAG: isoleucine--tRNA ligase [Bacteroidota bacterium]
MYPDPKGFAHPASEEAVLAKWQAEQIFEQSLAIRDGAPHFVFYEGPPTANGKPGIHHVMARTIKDLFCRYKTMQGFRVDRKAGWDTHGLPVEIEVEKELGLQGRDQIESYGVAEYNHACRESVLRYKDLWDTLTQRMGYWVDLDDPYVTFENDYIESVWSLLKKINDTPGPDGEPLLYRGYKIQWYSPGSGTVLSSHEVSLGYKEVQDPSVTIKFPVRGEADTYFLAWTTTPWTLPSNAGLAVGSTIDYAKVKRTNEEGDTEYVILATALLGQVLDDKTVEIVDQMTGAELVGMRYEPVFSAFEDLHGEDAAWKVVAADFVSTEDGTGIVHMAPAFGADDFLIGQKEGLPMFNPVRADGTFDGTYDFIEGQWFKEADRAISRDLRQRGLLLKHQTYLHNYPHDWRKGTPLMSYPVDSWFIRTTAIKDRLVALNKTINWQPEGIGTGRFGAWLDGNVDWAISRMRYWATPLPIWVSDRYPDHVEVIGTIAELRARCGGAFPEDAINPGTGEVDLHRPYVDAITWPDGNGGTMRRVPDLLDVWFDSGAMPYAQWHYLASVPDDEQDPEIVAQFKANFPADFIAEGVDQTRGWFYTLHAIAALTQQSVAYENVVVNGLVLDAEGQKMSKSKGNAVDPFATIAEHGADPVRWTLMAASPPWESLRYDDARVLETRRKLFGTLTNTYSFFATYANIDGFAYDASARMPVADRAELDRWVVSRLQTTIAETTDAYDGYHPTKAARAVETFVDDLSNWYVRRGRRRYWNKVAGLGSLVEGQSQNDSSPATSDLGPDKQAAYETLYECLLTVAQLMAPLAPFYSEWLFGNLATGRDDLPASVHLTDFPQVVEAERDETLEYRMAVARSVASTALALRNEAQLNVRQPLGTLRVVTGNAGVDEVALAAVAAIVREEVNVKTVEGIAADSGLVQKTAKPNFKALGRRLGKQMKAANQAIRSLTTDDIVAYEQTGTLTLDLNGGAVTFGEGDIDVQSEGLDGQLVGQDAVTHPNGQVTSVVVALDPAITDSLRAEGYAREFVNRVQTLRKRADFDVTDRIAITFAAETFLTDALAAHAATIRNETLAVTLHASEQPEGETVETFAEREAIDGTPITIALQRVLADADA